MKNSNSPTRSKTATESMDQILHFLESQSSFKFSMNDLDLEITQKEDLKFIRFKLEMIERVIERVDYDGSQFIQINFTSGLKLLVTRNLIGFKPYEVVGFDTSKIPKVVTTVDLSSITKAIEDMSDDTDSVDSLTEMEVLRKVYQSILFGALAVGFEMRSEKDWFTNYLLHLAPASA